MVSNEALHNSLELANSKTPPPLLKLLNDLSSLNPLPSSKFFLTLFFGSGSYFLASAPGNFPLHELKRMADKIKIAVIFRFFIENSSKHTKT